MDPIIGGALISGATSLFSGIFGNKSAKKQQERQIAFAREEREYNKPINVRARAEEAGFNPLLFAGPGVGQANAGHLPGGSNNYMGSAIADIGLIAADAWKSKAAETSRIAQLEDENKELQKRLVDQTLRPPMGGMYQRGGPSIKPPAAKAVGGPIEPTAAASDEGTLPATLPILFGGMEITPAGKNSDADVTEGRYGDIVGPIMGIRAIYDDVRHTIETPRLQGALDAFGNKREYLPHELPTYKAPAAPSAISLAEASIKMLEGGAGSGALREQLKNALAYAKKHPDEAERVLNPLLGQLRGSDFFK